MDVKCFLRALSLHLLSTVYALNVIGILVINSMTNQNMSYVGRQVAGMILGTTVITLLCSVLYQKLLRYTVPVFVLCAILLLTVRFFGKNVDGAKRWIALPVLGQVQPSEFAKIGVVMFFSWLLDKSYESINQPRSLLLFAASVIIPIGPIGSEPDLSTVIVVAVSTAAMLLTAGISHHRIDLVLLVTVPFVISTVFLLKRGIVLSLEEYQVRRTLAFLYPV